jgi:DHA1 family bicyclomycin/chloramphenicol resistance-like MFS transporter
MNPATGAANVAVPPVRPVIGAAVASITLALLLGLQALTTDLYLPALPMLASELRAPMPAVQLTMSALIMGFGLSQLVWGPVADRFGRRPVLLAGLALHALSAIGAALAPQIETVVMWRTLQGVGMSASVVCARAMLRDLYEPYEGAHVMSRALTGLGLLAIAAPLAGGVLATLAGWRSTMGALALFSLGLLGYVAWRVPETIRSRNPHATQAAPLLRQMGRTLAHPTFRAWTLLVCFAYGCLMVFLAGSSFVLIQGLGLSTWQCGLAMAAGSGSYVIGTIICRRLLRRYGLAGAVVRGAGFSALACVLMLVLGASGAMSVWAVLVPQCIFALGHGVHQPCGQAGAVSPFPHAADVASALAGFALAIAGMTVSAWLGVMLVGTEPRAYFFTQATLAALTVLVAWTLVRRHGELPRA